MDWLEYDRRISLENKEDILNKIKKKVKERGLEEKLQRDGYLYASEIEDIIMEDLK